MKKFIAAFDGLNFSESTMNYAVYFARHCNAHVVGVFLEDYTRHSYSMADITRHEGSDFDQHIEQMDIMDQEARKKSISHFEEICQDCGVSYSIHRDRNLAINELLHESIYADLLIIGHGESMSRYKEPSPTRFIRSLLNDVQCPVILAPEYYRPIDKFILLYDGEPSSVYAVRTFSYLIQSVISVETEVLCVKAPEESLHLPDNRLIREFVKRHFPKAAYVVLKGYPEDEIGNYIRRDKKDPVVVLGAYRRNRFSRLFRPSMADFLIRHLDVPLFIAHNKS